MGDGTGEQLAFPLLGFQRDVYINVEFHLLAASTGTADMIVTSPVRWRTRSATVSLHQRQQQQEVEPIKPTVRKPRCDDGFA